MLTFILSCWQQKKRRKFEDSETEVEFQIESSLVAVLEQGQIPAIHSDDLTV